MTTHYDERPSRILVSGLACLDIITVCDGYPQEDSDERCLEYYWQRGGNASNDCTVLTALGAQVDFVGILAHSRELQFVTDDFDAHGIEWRNSVVVNDASCSCPVSMCVVNARNGSRTIRHSRGGLRDFTADEFARVSLKEYGWAHFECRKTVAEVSGILNVVDKYNEQNRTPETAIITSLELEKPRVNSDTLFDKADYVFVSKEYAGGLGYHTMEEAVRGLHPRCRTGASIICAWGEHGAAAMTPDNTLHISPSFPPPQIRDTLGAGDTFLSSTVFSLNGGRSVSDAILFGCKMAGAKCGIKGYDGLKEISGTL